MKITIYKIFAFSDCFKLSTLKFANRAKNIKNAPIINEDLDQRTLLKKYEIELKKLRVQLEEKNKGLFDKSHLLQVKLTK